jgi:hypothetical protein
VSEIDFKYAHGKLSTISDTASCTSDSPSSRYSDPSADPSSPGAMTMLTFEYDAGVTIEAITLLGVEREPKGLRDAEYDAENKLYIRLLPIQKARQVTKATSIPAGSHSQNLGMRSTRMASSA